jgi:hypothetical protein
MLENSYKKYHKKDIAQGAPDEKIGCALSFSFRPNRASDAQIKGNIAVFLPTGRTFWDFSQVLT